MTAFPRFALVILRARVLIRMVLVLSGLGLAEKAVTATATIPFNFWAQDHEFQAGDYLPDNAVPGSPSIHPEGRNSAIGVSVILYAVPSEKDNSRVIFVH